MSSILSDTFEVCLISVVITVCGLLLLLAPIAGIGYVLYKIFELFA